MVTEDYVNFETAKLLKEKGFDCNTNCYYIEDSVTRTLFYSPIRENHNASIENNEFDIHINISNGKMSAPTLQMVMKWLREVYNLVIQIELIDFLEHGEVWLYCITERKTIKQLTGKDEDFTEHSYEEACEAAIKYCLENLI